MFFSISLNDKLINITDWIYSVRGLGLCVTKKGLGSKKVNHLVAVDMG